ncbi:unnamed protein product [Adineta ricciae]|uniref:NADH dehydrogenase [ubiquinone] 1 alpha subcomplex subunit 7 n=1 Tax=Adineta ricciae TaxID=249248 RepID=A0A816FK06_ADIRI|nr:unnamed protein product [Adineta ricciae]
MSSGIKNAATSAAPVVKRDINKWLARVREFLMLRKFTHNQRHEFEMAKRTQPAPVLPGGFAHKLSKNYYLDRDARRAVGQPQVVFSTAANNQLLTSAAQPQLTAGAPGQAAPQQASAATTSPFLSISEAEKQTAAILATGKKTSTPIRTPGQVYNWDG